MKTSPRFKPNQLVYVRTEDNARTYVGEVMSYETPDHTLMVRRVPNHPGTLETVSVSRIQGIAKGRHYVHFAEVAGVGQFPDDMLRYDVAVPVNFTLAEDEHGRKVPDIDPRFGFDKPIIAQVSEKASPRWTDARWASFLWAVYPIKSESIGPNPLPSTSPDRHPDGHKYLCPWDE